MKRHNYAHPFSLLAAGALAALGACSEQQSDDRGSSEARSSSSEEDKNLSSDEAFRLIQERNARWSGYSPFEHVSVFYDKSPDGIQWLIDNQLAKGTTGEWQAAEGLVLSDNPYSNTLEAPTHRDMVAIEGIITEGKRATISWYSMNSP